jgi:hypothetical protein
LNIDEAKKVIADLGKLVGHDKTAEGHRLTYDDATPGSRGGLWHCWHDLLLDEETYAALRKESRV